MDGVNAGRLKDINYEGILGNVPVDIESLWSKEDGHLPEFNWLEWKRRDLDWTAARPDVYVFMFESTTPSAYTNQTSPFYSVAVASRASDPRFRRRGYPRLSPSRSLRTTSSPTCRSTSSTHSYPSSNPKPTSTSFQLAALYAITHSQPSNRKPAHRCSG